MKKLFLALLILLAIISGIAITCYELSLRTPSVYELPDGFTGWVLIEFEKTNYPPVPKQNGKLIFKIGKDGRLFTSSKLEQGWARDEYYYVGTTRVQLPESWKKPGLIWGQGNGTTQKTGQSQIIFQDFFVGTEEQFKQSSKQGDPWPEPE
jgi:hypothetical protein